MKNSEIVSKIINSLRFTSKDEHVSRRYVLKILRDSAKMMIAQKMGERTITDEDNLYSEIKCVEFIKDDIVNCPIIEFRRCRVLMKSKKKMPQAIFSRSGSSIKEVTDVDGLYEFKVITSDQYRRNQKRGISIKSEVYVYLASDGYLYIPDVEIYSVNLRMITMETEKIDNLCECTDKNCLSGWDYEFIVPDKISEAVFTSALQIISSTYKAIQPDENPNLNENIKN